IHAHQPRALHVVTGEIHVCAELMPIEEKPYHRGEHDGPDELRRNDASDPAHEGRVENRVPDRRHAQPAPVCQHQDHARPEELCSDGRDQGWYSDLHDDDAVQYSRAKPCQEAGKESEPDIPGGGEHEAERRHPECHDRAEGKVDLSRDDHKRQRDCHQGEEWRCRHECDINIARQECPGRTNEEEQPDKNCDEHNADLEGIGPQPGREAAPARNVRKWSSDFFRLVHASLLPRCHAPSALVSRLPVCATTYSRSINCCSVSSFFMNWPATVPLSSTTILSATG